MGYRLLSVRTACIAGAAALVATAAACSCITVVFRLQRSRADQRHHNLGAPKAGGSITVLESSGYSGAWSNLDPAQDKEGAALQDFNSAIYGQLFELGSGGTVVGDLATGYSFSPDAKTVTITIRQGVKFTDGTPFNAQAVFYNWKRDLGPVAITNGLAPTWLIAKNARAEGQPARHANAARRGGHPGHRAVHDRRPPDRAERRLHQPAVRLDRQLDRLADRPAEAKARRSASTRSAPGRSRW